MSSCDNYDTCIVPKGHHYIKADLHELVFFIRNAKAIPWGKSVSNTAKIDNVNEPEIELLGYDKAHYTMYWDDGISTFDSDKVNIKEL